MKKVIKDNHTRFYFIMIITILLFLLIIIRLFYLQVINKDYYVSALEDLMIVEDSDEVSPRGKIYDRNGNVIVDNVTVRKIIYEKNSDATFDEEVEIATFLATYLDLDYSVTDKKLKEFWIKSNSLKANELITEAEWKELDERKLSSEDIYNLKLERVSGSDISVYTELDKKMIYIYYLMNDGYYYDDKIIKKDATDLEYAIIGTNLDKLKGISIKVDWDRYYPYGDTLRTILGNVSLNGIPYELKDYYLNLGYDLSDRVGTSYLEYQYESYLKGKKAIYKLSADGSKKLMSEASGGNDIKLTIDINLQQEVENIISEELLIAKNEAHTEYLDSAFVVIQNPNTGEILAMAGKEIKPVDGNYEIYDYTAGVVTSPVTVGSMVKGASHIVGYNTGNLSFGEVRSDNCIKIAATPLKCSFKNYGNINDLQALQYSSNTYQFQTAIKVGNGTYTYNGPLRLEESAFDIYRNVFNQFGLGVKTEIDLPVESLGYIGDSKVSGLLLDFSIGQYDTYTPIQLSQYISTIANGGSRMQPHLLSGVYKSTFKPLTESIYEFEDNVLNKVDTKAEYIDRVKQGFKLVFTSGTGRGYIDPKYDASGKTGTAESFVDTDSDGIIDTATTTSTIGAYAPSDKPVVSFVVVCPDIAPNDVSYGSMTRITQRITNKVSQKYFEIYE